MRHYLKFQFLSPVFSGKNRRVGARSISYNTESPESKTVPVEFKISLAIIFNNFKYLISIIFSNV